MYIYKPSSWFLRLDYHIFTLEPEVAGPRVSAIDLLNLWLGLNSKCVGSHRWVGSSMMTRICENRTGLSLGTLLCGYQNGPSVDVRAIL